MTSKEKVLSVHPDAYAHHWGGWRDGEEGWVIVRDCAEHSERLSAGESEAEAWDDAASKLPSAPSPAEETASSFICPVCEYNMAPYKPVGYNICPQCGTEFGLSDADATHEELRAAWIADGRKFWFKRAVPEPVSTEGAVEQELTLVCPIHTWFVAICSTCVAANFNRTRLARPSAPVAALVRLIGPSGDGAHVEVDGQWYAYGNTAENAWKNALIKALQSVAAPIAPAAVSLEKVWRHLVKRMYDECGATKADDFIRRVEAGEHDAPSPWNLAKPSAEGDGWIAWDRPPASARRDIVGQRNLPDGRTEYLMHNEALCHPYYVAVSLLAAPPSGQGGSHE